MLYISKFLNYLRDEEIICVYTSKGTLVYRGLCEDFKKKHKDEYYYNCSISDIFTHGGKLQIQLNQ